MTLKTWKYIGYLMIFGVSVTTFYLFWMWTGVLPLTIITGIVLAIFAGVKLGFSPVIWLFGKVMLYIWLGMVVALILFTFKELYPGTWVQFLLSIVAFIVATIVSINISLKVAAKSSKW